MITFETFVNLHQTARCHIQEREGGTLSVGSDFSPVRVPNDVPGH